LKWFLLVDKRRHSRFKSLLIDPPRKGFNLILSRIKI
jgi:tRNA/tmRNA/rRNA uracil-C5-methylase (TrmA/RlmC/RlmD family)